MGRQSDLPIACSTCRGRGIAHSKKATNLMIVESLVAYGLYRMYKALASAPASSAPVKPRARTPGKVITFVGRTGAGKSSTANSLLGYAAFDVGAEHGSTTLVAARDYVGGYQLRDTPGLMDDTAFDDAVWTAVEDSELVVYTTTGQLYRPEIETVRCVRDRQRQWDLESETPGRRKLVLYVNGQDYKESTMTRAVLAEEARLIKEQVATWIPEDRVAFGAAAPMAQGEGQPARLEELRSLIQANLSLN
jgi:hypothetical protein